MTEYWAAVDDDGWPWVFQGEPQWDAAIKGWDDCGEAKAFCHNSTIRDIACGCVPEGTKRKLKSLDFVQGTVEYEGVEIHG